MLDVCVEDMLGGRNHEERFTIIALPLTGYANLGMSFKPLSLSIAICKVGE